MLCLLQARPMADGQPSSLDDKYPWLARFEDAQNAAAATSAERAATD